MWSVCGLPVARPNLWTTKTYSDLRKPWSSGGDLNSRPLRPELPVPHCRRQLISPRLLATEYAAAV